MSNIGKQKIYIQTNLLNKENQSSEEDTLSISIRTIKSSSIADINPKNNTDIISKFSKDNGEYKQIIFCRTQKYNTHPGFNREEESITIKKLESSIKEKLIIRQYKCLNIPKEFNIQLSKENDKEFLIVSTQDPQFKPKNSKNWGLLNKKIKENILNLYNVDPLSKIRSVENRAQIKDNNTDFSKFTYFFDNIKQNLLNNNLTLELKGVGYKLEFDESSRNLSINIGYSNKININVPEYYNIQIENQNILKIQLNSILYYTQSVQYLADNLSNNILLEKRIFTQSYQKLTQFIHNILQLKPAYKDKYKGKGFVLISK